MPDRKIPFSTAILIIIIAFLFSVSLWIDDFFSLFQQAKQTAVNVINSEEQFNKNHFNFHDKKFGEIPLVCRDNYYEMYFSPGGERAAYYCMSYQSISDEHESEFFVVDDKKEKEYEVSSIQLLSDEDDHLGKFSPDGKLFAYLVYENEKVFLVVNGQEGKTYYDIRDFKFSPDGKKYAYIVYDDSKDNDYLYLNEGVIAEQEYINEFTFSPDSQKIAYVGEKYDEEEGDYKDFVVVDGKISERHYDKIYNLIFSPDSKQIAYFAEDGKKLFLVVNDQEEFLDYDSVSNLVYGADSKKIAYAGIKKEPQPKLFIVDRNPTGQNEYLAVDCQKVGCSGVIIRNLVLSPDGQKTAYLVSVGRKMEKSGQETAETEDFVGLNDQHYQYYPSIYGNLVFSSDSQKLAYIATIPSKDQSSWMGTRRLVINDEEIDSDYGALEMTPIFSQDSRHVAYLADRDGESVYLMLDGKPVNFYNNVDSSSIVFSPDGRYLGFGAELSGELWWKAIKVE